MHGLLLGLTKGGKLRGRMREGLILLIEVWSLLTWHSEDRLVLLRSPSRRLWGPIAIAWLGSTSTIWCLSWHASYLSSLRLFEWQHLLVVGRTLHSTRTWLLIADSPWVVPLWVSILKIVAIFSNCRKATMMIFWSCIASFFACRCLQVRQFEWCGESIFNTLILACRWQCMNSWSFRGFATFRIRIL